MKVLGCTRRIKRDAQVVQLPGTAPHFVRTWQSMLLGYQNRRRPDHVATVGGPTSPDMRTMSNSITMQVAG